MSGLIYLLRCFMSWKVTSRFHVIAPEKKHFFDKYVISPYLSILGFNYTDAALLILWYTMKVFSECNILSLINYGDNTCNRQSINRFTL